MQGCGKHVFAWLISRYKRQVRWGNY